jgi:hypothetical protein
MVRGVKRFRSAKRTAWNDHNMKRLGHLYRRTLAAKANNYHSTANTLANFASERASAIK